ncbi:helix-turn-helix domain-containing protein [Agromyces sp. ZXT2-3]|uniref:helix-turn-helix domain-containing protein n=1 Tax=Agromyces sp. ZXT2-3 TaxID=3461152 RepID=UPI004055242A
MGWSTRELAELAGTTVNTVRHYHRAGLLDEPERLYNGYKQYGARHLVRLLQIRRLRDLGVPLAQIEALDTSGDRDRDRDPAAALLAIDADLAASIERMQRARAEIRAILDGSTVTDVPPGFEDIAGRLSGADRSLMLVYAQLYDDAAMTDLRHMAEEERDAVDDEFDALPADADEATRQRLADALTPKIAGNLADFPWLLKPDEHLPKGPRVTREAFIETVFEVYNEAQRDVITRASRRATGTTDDASTISADDQPE